MERFTKLNRKKDMVKLMDTPMARGHAECWLRLCVIEDILGDEYDLDRLRELVEADREGRCVVMPCQPGDKISYKSGAGLWFNAVVDDYTPENIFITAETEITNSEPLSQVFSIFEIEAALRRGQDG